MHKTFHSSRLFVTTIFILSTLINSFNSSPVVFGQGNVIIKVKNKGWYVADMSVVVRDKSTTLETYYSKHIWSPNDEIIVVPQDFTKVNVLLQVNAIGGIRIFSLDIKKNYACFHVWGTLFFPAWTEMPCW